MGLIAVVSWLGALFLVRHPFAAEVEPSLSWLFGKLRARLVPRSASTPAE